MLTLNTESSSLPRLRTSPSSDLVPPSPAKKPKPNSPEKHDSGISGRRLRSGPIHNGGITDADIDKLVEEEFKTYWEDLEKLWGPHEVRPVYGPTLFCPEILPKGYAWGSFMNGSDIKKVAYRMICAHCGKIGDHMTDKCLDKDSEEAKEHRKQCEKSMKQMAANLEAMRSSKF